MPQYDSIIRNGTVVDGSGQIAGYKADVGITNGKIAAIGRLRGDAKRELDATDCIVAPGAIEIHSHYDHQLAWDPYCTSAGWHGVTTATLGTCGFGWAPCRPDDHFEYAKILSRVTSIPPANLEKWLRWDWESYPEWLDSVDRGGLGINVASMVPISPLRAYVMGVEDACGRNKMTAGELDKMKALYREAMAAGSWGFSGHKNPEDRTEEGGMLPSHLTSEEEVLALAEITGEFGIGSVYWTNGGEPREKALLRKMCEVSGRPLVWTGVVQHKADDLDPWREDLAWSEENLKLGLPIYGLAITRLDAQLRLAETNIFDTMPAWLDPFLGTPEERIVKLSDPVTREAMKKELGGELGTFHNEWDRVVIAKAVEERNRKWQGKSVADIVEATGAHPVDAFLDLAIDEKLLTEFEFPAFIASNDAATAKMLTAPSTTPSISDGGAHYRFLSAGNWPTAILSEWVREKQVMSLEQAHYKLSALPAWTMGYRDRGVLREGMAADIMVYDLERLGSGDQERRTDTPTGDLRLVRESEGYRYTLVNGEVTFEEGECSGALPGRLLRSTDYAV